MESKPSQNADRSNIFEIPLIPQLFNTCGLSTVLMLTADNGQKSHSNRQFLLGVLNLIRPILLDQCDDIDQEICLQYVLQYLLLKIENQYSNNYRFLFNYLHGKFGYIFDDQVAIHIHLITTKQEHLKVTHNFTMYESYRLYLEKNGLVTPNLLRNEMFTMKTDLELKFLMEIFGYSFLPYESGDGTGAIFLPPKSKVKHQQKLIEKLENVLKTPNHRILYGDSNHWVALTGISQDSDLENWLHFNDPMIPAAKKIAIRDLDATHRFYVFEKSGIDKEKMWGQIYTAIQKDIRIEAHLQQTAAIERVLAIRGEITSTLFDNDEPDRKITMQEFEETEKTSQTPHPNSPQATQKKPLSSDLHEQTKNTLSNKSDFSTSENNESNPNIVVKTRKSTENEWDTDIDFDFEE